MCQRDATYREQNMSLPFKVHHFRSKSANIIAPQGQKMLIAGCIARDDRIIKKELIFHFLKERHTWEFYLEAGEDGTRSGTDRGAGQAIGCTLKQVADAL